MEYAILLAAVVVVSCVLLNKISNQMGIPMLLAFILLGMVFGSDGVLGITFDNYAFAEQVCAVALIFIMFYGGFGTRWDEAKPVAVKAGLLSTLGVLLTAVLTGLFCHYLLGFTFWEGMLVGAVISSTDAASVFSILRSRKLGLKEHTDSMLELESGSNDPCSYMLTIIVLAVMSNGITSGDVLRMVVFQLLFGALTGVVVAFGAGYVLRRFHFATAGFDMVFVIGTALLSYALAAVMGGNGYLSAYLCGILLGNVKIRNKKALVHFFDGMTGLMQMLIFFLLGLLATPSRLPQILLPALGVMLFLTFVARPVSVFMLLTPFRCSVRQQLLVSFAGLRGAASIVFAIMAIIAQPALQNDLFHIIFCIVLLSISVQGSLLPVAARRLRMSDNEIDVMKTFNDYSEEVDLQLIEVRVSAGHPWAGKPIREIILPPDSLMVMLQQNGGWLIPDGQTVLQAGDTAVLSGHPYADNQVICLQEKKITAKSRWIGKQIQDFSPDSGELVVMILRGEQTVIPKGNTVIERDDLLVISSVPLEAGA